MMVMGTRFGAERSGSMGCVSQCVENWQMRGQEGAYCHWDADEEEEVEGLCDVEGPSSCELVD